MPRRRRLPPNVQKHGSGYRAVFQHGGERRWGPVFRLPEQAARYANAYRGVRAPGKPLTLGEGMQLVRDDLATHARSGGTLAWYESHWLSVGKRWLPETKLTAIRIEHVEEWLRWRLAEGASPTTVRHGLVALKRITRLAFDKGRLHEDQLAKLKPPKQRRARRDVLTPQEIANHVAAIRRAGRGRIADLIEFAYATGMRRAELARLQTEDVDMERFVVFVRGKTDTREQPIGTAGRAAAKALCEARARPMIGTVHAIAALFKEAQAITADRRLHPHALRHSYATALARAGTRPYQLRDLLGHKHLQQSMTYYHASGDDSRAAAEALRLPPATPVDGDAPARSGPEESDAPTATPGSRSQTNTEPAE